MNAGVKAATPGGVIIDGPDKELYDKEKELTPLDEQKFDPNQPGNDYIDLEYIGDLDSIFDQAKRRHEEYKSACITINGGIYYEALAFYSGRQYFEWNFRTKTLDYVKPQTPNALRVSSNRIVGKVRSVVAHMTANLPISNVRPNSPNDQDIAGAKCGEIWLKHSDSNNGTRKIKRKAARNNLIFGHGWLKDYWDEFGGKAYDATYKSCDYCNGTGRMDSGTSENSSMPTEETSETQTSESATSSEGIQDICESCQGTGQELSEGNAVIDQPAGFDGKTEKVAITPLQLYYDPSIVDWEKDAMDCVEASYWSIDKIRSKIPNCGDLSWDEGETLEDNPWASMINFVIDAQSGTGKHGKMVYEYNAKSSPHFPKGLQIIWVDGIVRVARAMPTFEGRKLPYEHSKYIDISGLLRGLGLVEMLKPTQTAYNKTLSQALENNQRMNNVHWLINKNTTKLVRTITNDGGQVLEFEGSAPPISSTSTAGSTAAMTQYLEKVLDSNFDMLSGVPKMAEGFSDPSFNSGDQELGAIEASKAIHLPEIDEYVEMLCASDSNELEIVQKNMTHETMVSFVKEDGEFYVDAFDATKIANNWNVTTMPGSAISLSRSAQIKEMQPLVQIVMNAQSPDPETAKYVTSKLIDLISNGDKQKFVSETTLHIRQAKRFIADIKKGAMTDPRAINRPWLTPYLKTYIGEFENILNSSDFDYNWPPQAKQILIDAWQMFQVSLQETMQKAAQTQGGSPHMPSPTHPPHGIPPNGGHSSPKNNMNTHETKAATIENAAALPQEGGM